MSFKLDPQAVIAGQFDESMRDWFENAPRNHAVYWVYWHDPENDIEDGKFTAAQYQAAFTHLDKLADQADNPQLRSTLVLMSYTTEGVSGRDWKDYYPGDDTIDIFAWDVYNRSYGDGGYPHSRGPARRAPQGCRVRR